MTASRGGNSLPHATRQEEYLYLRILYEAPLAFLRLFRYPRYVELLSDKRGRVYAQASDSLSTLVREFGIAIIVVAIIGVIVAGPA